MDDLLVGRQLAESLDLAQRYILAHQVTVDGRVATKAGERVAADAVVVLTPLDRYVGRGGLKLEAALRSFGLNVEGLVCVDVGASTGGFTDCLLQHGARRVFALDVGRSQLHERLRGDARVTVLDHTNARQVDAAMFEEAPALFVVDVSFISAVVVLRALAACAGPEVQAVVLVKPQFEAGRAEASRGRGVIRGADTHQRVVKQVIEQAMACGWLPRGLMASPIRGGAGNREFLLWLLRGGEKPTGALAAAPGFDIDAEVARACMDA